MFNIANLTPKALEELTEVPPEAMRLWRNRGFLDGIGKVEENGRWKYSTREAVKLAIANHLRLSGVPPKVAVMIGQDIHDDVLKTAGFYRDRTCDYEMLAIWNGESGGTGQAVTSRYFPWASYQAQYYEEIRRFIEAPAPIVADLHKLCVAFPEPLKRALGEAIKGGAD